MVPTDKLTGKIVCAACFVLAIVIAKAPLIPVLVVLYFFYLRVLRGVSLAILVLIWLVATPLVGPHRGIALVGVPDLHLHRVLALLAVGVLLFGANESGVGLRFNRLDWVIVGYMATLGASIAGCFMYRTPLRIMIDSMLIPLCGYVIVKGSVGANGYLEKMQEAVFIAVLVFGAIGLVELAMGEDVLALEPVQWNVFRVNGPMRRCDDYGLCMNMLMMVLLGGPRAAEVGARGKRLLRPAAMIVGLLAVAATFTRGVWLSLAAGLGVRSIRRGARFAVLSTCAIGLVVVLGAQYALMEFWPEVYQLRVQNQQTINARMATYKSAWAMFADHPLLGVGFAAFSETQSAFPSRYFREYNGEPCVDTPHNMYLSLLAETGLVGLVVASLVAVQIIRSAYRLSVHGVQATHRAYGETMLCVTAVYLAGGLTNEFSHNIDFVNKYVFVFLGGLSGLIDCMEGRSGGAAHATVPQDAGGM